MKSHINKLIEKTRFKFKKLIETIRFNLFKWLMKYAFYKEQKYIEHGFEEYTSEILRKNPVYTVMKEIQRYWILDKNLNCMLLHTFINGVIVDEHENCMTVHLYTMKPGVNIGTKGQVIDSIETTLTKLFNKNVHINIIETKRMESE